MAGHWAELAFSHERAVITDGHSYAWPSAGTRINHTLASAAPQPGQPVLWLSNSLLEEASGRALHVGSSSRISTYERQKVPRGADSRSLEYLIAVLQSALEQP